MVKLYDASILTGPPSLGGAIILPKGRTMPGGTHEVSNTLGPLEVRPTVPGYLSKDDILVVGGVEYGLSRIDWMETYCEFTGGQSGNVSSLVLSLTGTSDRSSVLRLWVPLDGRATPYDGTPGGTIMAIHAQMTTPENRWVWAELSTDDEFKIDVTCFATGTLIETAEGMRPVHLLRVGDMVRTRDHGMQPLRWLGGRRLSAHDLAVNPKLNPIRIAAGALGRGMPARDLTVSPQHRILVRSAIAERMTGSAEVLIAAVHLLGHPGIERVEAQDGIGYWHLMFDRHEIVFAEGAEAESLYLGPMAVASMTDDALEELRALFPDLVGEQRDELPPTARPVMRGKPVAKLIERQVRNFKPLVSALA